MGHGRGNMETLDQIGAALLFFGAGGWIAWLFGGTWLNRRRAVAVSRWLYHEARACGDRLAMRWITLAAFELIVTQPRPPFRRLSFTAFLESREMPFVWLWNRVRRRGDLLLLRAELRQAPVGELELFRPHSVLAGDARRAAEEAGWTPALGADGLWRAGNGAAAFGERLLAALGPYAARVERLAVRRGRPELLLAVSLAGLELSAAPPLAQRLEQLAALASRQP